MFAIFQWRRAKQQETLAYSRELAAAAKLNLETRPELSLLLAAEAARIKATDEADLALRQALFESHLRAVFPGPANAVAHLALSPDGRFVISTLQDGDLAIWEPGSASSVVTVPIGVKTLGCCAQPGP